MAEDTSAPAGTTTGGESSLSNWAGDYVTEMLGKGQALGNQDYQGYMGPLTAGTSELQNVAFGGIGGLTLPTDQMGTAGYHTTDSLQADKCTTIHEPLYYDCVATSD